MALPAMSAVRRAYPEAEIAVAAIPAVAPLFEERTGAAADRVLTLADRGREVDVLRGGGFEAILLLPNSFRSALVARQARIAERWGYGGGLRGWALTRAIPRPRRTLHQSEYYRELTRALGMENGDELPRLEATPRSIARAADLLEREGVRDATTVVGIAPGAAYGHAKRWPPRRMADLIVRLARERAMTAVLVGAAGDRPAGREIESVLPAEIRVVNLIGRTDLRVLVGLLPRCAAFVSNDSGAMHLAAAAGVPVVAIFGPTDERVTAPRGSRGKHEVLVHPVFCRPCMLRECPIDHRCMKGIGVDAVLAAVARVAEPR
jgi:heptosyltransferase-2